ncbi:MAG: hydroxyethylthiazole kinase [Candidatus Omnitrophica bacterium]|nr:hydroxyethylthiazole kinase [Candidatus Omnitrophota bacterium]MDD4012635.1 hydroxyethylthiazole kinase [Candidatus Omnitrophota bacterium]
MKMRKTGIKAYEILKRVRKASPLVHHMTNWVTIYDCANIVKVVGASPVMAHAPEEAAEMARMASSLVLNIGTLTTDMIAAMKKAAAAANRRKIPVLLDVCGAGATRLRDKSCFELLKKVRIDIIKGNASEIARISGEDVRTKGVDSSEVRNDMVELIKTLASSRKCTIVMTGREDIISDGTKVFTVKNGHEMMSRIVGTGCMAASLIGTFSAVEKDLAYAAASALTCFGVSGELAARSSSGPASFKTALFDRMYSLDQGAVTALQRVYS